MRTKNSPYRCRKLTDLSSTLRWLLRRTSPCGYFGSSRECKCSPIQIQRYVGKISGPLMDRIDIHIDSPVNLRASRKKWRAPRARRTYENASSRHAKRRPELGGEGVYSIGMSSNQIREFVRSTQRVSSSGKDGFARAVRPAHDRILKFLVHRRSCRQREDRSTHISEAINYRSSTEIIGVKLQISSNCMTAD